MAKPTQGLGWASRACSTHSRTALSLMSPYPGVRNGKAQAKAAALAYLTAGRQHAAEDLRKSFGNRQSQPDSFQPTPARLCRAKKRREELRQVFFRDAVSPIFDLHASGPLLPVKANRDWRSRRTV